MKKESDLIKNLKNKNTQNVAFENLIQQYKEPLYWHIRRILLDHDDSNDVLQNTFVKVFKGIQNFKGDSKLYTWIYRIATNESINFLKIKSRKYFQGSEEMTNYMLSNLKDELAGNLSGGQKKLLELGRTMMTDAKLVLLDEPGAGVNPTLMLKIIDMIRRLNIERGYTFCIIEHDMDLIADLCQKVVVLSEGQVLTEGTMSNVKNDERVIQAYFGGGVNI